jgi:hypothetical protein
MRNLPILAVGVALASYAVTSHAAIKIYATRAGNYATNTTLAVLPLNNTGATSLTFNHASAKQWILTYSAECATGGASNGWVDLEIYVNQSLVAPTAGDNDAFCSTNHTSATDGFVRASITVVIQGIAGTNRVQINAHRNLGATTIHIGDSALVVHD